MLLKHSELKAVKSEQMQKLFQNTHPPESINNVTAQGQYIWPVEDCLCPTNILSTTLQEDIYSFT